MFKKNSKNKKKNRDQDQNKKLNQSFKLKDLGEFGLIHRISSRFFSQAQLPLNIEGIGDDCAVVSNLDGKSTLITTDLLIENVHFLKKSIPAKALGYKALAVNISDISAMGGIPQYAFLSLALPPSLSLSWIDSFFSGFKELANSEKIHLLGGDTTRSTKHITINITLIGSIKTNFIKRRSQAKLNDLICVTGFLGDSAAGLEMIRKKNRLQKSKPTKFQKNENYLIKKHLKPRIQSQEGQWLAQQSAVHAMMDVSDGIHSDLQRIMEQSHCRVEIDIEKIPLSPSFKQVCKKYHLDDLSLACAGGEDYCLLVSLSPASYKRIAKTFEKKFSHPLYCIGKITNSNKDKSLSYLKNKKTFKLKPKGFNHFY